MALIMQLQCDKLDKLDKHSVISMLIKLITPICRASLPSSVPSNMRKKVQ